MQPDPKDKPEEENTYPEFEEYEEGDLEEDGEEQFDENGIPIL